MKRKKIIQQRLLQEINAKLVHSIRSIDEYKLNGFDAAWNVIKYKEGLRSMNEIESLVFMLEANDRNILNQSNINRQKLARVSSQQMYLIAAIFLFILGLTHKVPRHVRSSW